MREYTMAKAGNNKPRPDTTKPPKTPRPPKTPKK